MINDSLFFGRLDQVKRIVAESTDCRQTVGHLKPFLSDNDVRRDFYTLLQSAEWIAPLREAGYFDAPPGEETAPGGNVYYPRWPASGYLVRMAENAPVEVAEIFAKIETGNAPVVGDMVKAALAMPDNVASSLVPAVCRAVKNDVPFYLMDACNLCIKLTKGKELDSAMKLADALFTPQFERWKKNPSWQREYWYKDGLIEVVPLLSVIKAHEFLPKLCDWLKASVDTDMHVDPKTGSDMSCSWRPAVEDHEQNRDYDFSGMMVGFVRLGFEEAISRDGLSLKDALQIIERYSYLIFRRIRIHLIGEFADQDTDLAKHTILNQELFGSREYKHEYAMLVGKCLTLLSPEQQKKWFGCIDDGPEGEGYTDEQTEYWKFRKLHWVRTHLEGERKAFYDRMFAEHGEPVLADMDTSTKVSWGSESPMTVDDLSAMKFEEAVDKVSSWKPTGSRFMEPSIEGLASTFREYIATDPERFSNHAGLLKDKPAIFVRNFINQMSEAVRAGKNVNFPSVIDLCDWVIKQPVYKRTTPEQQCEMLVDKDWQMTRDEISQFAEIIVKSTENEKPKYPLEGLREPLWGLIEPLCKDRAKSYIIRDISKDDPRVRDYLELGLNSPRGRAVKAALEYARWVANHIKEGEGEQEIILGGFDAMPEVRKMLNWQIASGNRSVEALSIIGYRIGLIYWIDQKWLKENAEQLFPLQSTPPLAEGWAAWNAFLVWVRPHVEFYKIFKSQFSCTVNQAADVELAERTREQPMHKLGEHLMILYGRGQLGLDDDGNDSEGLLRQFFKIAIPDIRRHVIGFVGRTLGGDEEIPKEVIERFKTLWDMYWAGDGKGKEDAKEKPDAWLFGCWFTCGKFPKEWALERLEQFVEINPTPEPDSMISEKLAEIAHVDIARALRILDRMVRGDKDGWRTYGRFDSAKTILTQALKADDDTRVRAENLIDYLGRRGYIEFGELLK